MSKNVYYINIAFIATLKYNVLGMTKRLSQWPWGLGFSFQFNFTLEISLIISQEHGFQFFFSVKLD